MGQSMYPHSDIGRLGYELTVMYQSVPLNLVPLSDCAGEVLAVGEDVTGWKKGDRVCSNFATDHIHGRTTPAIQATSLGGQAHGVLTQYRIFPAHVCSIYLHCEKGCENSCLFLVSCGDPCPFFL